MNNGEVRWHVRKSACRDGNIDILEHSVKASGCSLTSLVALAYGIMPEQIEAENVALLNERYDVVIDSNGSKPFNGQASLRRLLVEKMDIVIKEEQAMTRGVVIRIDRMRPIRESGLNGRNAESSVNE